MPDESASDLSLHAATVQDGIGRVQQDGEPSQDPAELLALREELIGLRRTLATQPVIEQAKGMLMLRFGIDAETAFAALTRMSQEHNVKVRDIARAMEALAVRTSVDGDLGPVSPLARRIAAELLRPGRRHPSSD